MDEQLGLESSVDEYIANLCDIFLEVKRVLKKSATCFVNLGDTFGDDKSLCLIPFRFAIEMLDRGWTVRNVIVWKKPNAMPSSVKDRFTVDFEYLFFFVKSRKYYFERQYEPHLWADKDYRSKRHWKKNLAKSGKMTQKRYSMKGVSYGELGRNKRTVWTIPTKGYPGSHFAVYPEKLCETPIRAGCPINGLVLDPFFGSGTTGVVARKHQRNYIGIELSKDYIKIAQERLNQMPIRDEV